MRQYSIDWNLYAEDDNRLQAVLARIHNSKSRPLCLCARPGVPMYVSKVAGHYVINACLTPAQITPRTAIRTILQRS